ncbi:hypothetical protein B0H21DRAFT_721773 [Amylocystis lapponica]|nr:hypothetical protein B0H21DRAFT_721773 [Amylocystis lapponica]
MLSRWSLTLSLLPTVLVHALALSALDQTVFHVEVGSSPPEENGVLKSFAVPYAHGWDVERILEVAETARADIWQVTPSHVDVYFSSPDDYLASQFSGASLVHNTTEILRAALIPPDKPRPPSIEWNLTSLSNTTFHSNYHPLDEIEVFMQQMAALYPDIVKLDYIGHSAEGREMVAMRLSRDSGNFKTKKGFVVTGAQHAREWIATSTALYLVHALVSSSAEPYAMSSLLDFHDFYIVPVPNPDGYVYTWENHRLWYKNRQVIGPYEKCIGLDMNRNWGYKWKAKADFPTFKPNNSTAATKPSTPTDPCTHWYPGHRAFESPEVNNIANYITTLPALQAYLDLRSYGQMLSTPFSYSCKETPKDAEDQIEAALGATRAIKQVHGTAFTTGNLCSMLYKAPGNIVDWMYAKAGIKYSYAVHLRDTGTYGFSLPEEWIRPVGEEIASMTQFLSRFISGRKY